MLDGIEIDVVFKPVVGNFHFNKYFLNVFFGTTNGHGLTRVRSLSVIDINVCSCGFVVSSFAL